VCCTCVGEVCVWNERESGKETTCCAFVKCVAEVYGRWDAKDSLAHQHVSSNEGKHAVQ
jgi:hypothetical protein